MVWDTVSTATTIPSTAYVFADRGAKEARKVVQITRRRILPRITGLYANHAQGEGHRKEMPPEKGGMAALEGRSTVMVRGRLYCSAARDQVDYNHNKGNDEK